MAEQIVNEFTVNRPIDEAWPIICDVERIAPCLPGAELEEIEGDVYRGKVKVKLGAVTAQFKGEAQFVDRDDEAHHARLKAKGRDTGGRGNAEADIVADAEALSPTSTKCTVTADLHITGKVAQFGRGIMGDVSKKLMDQFAGNLNRMLDEQGATPADTEPAPEPAQATPAAESTASAPAGGNGASTASEPRPTVRKINGPAAEPVDLAGVAGPAVIKRVLPLVLALLVVVLLLRRRK
jgi:carbon monoxide dehydrogenase subunit G